MESKRTATTYFIPPGKFLLMENALGNPDLIQSSVSSDCRVTIVDSANFPLDELEQWPTFRLTSADIKLKLGNGAYYIYIVVPTPENTESTLAFISYNTALVDRDGYQVLESTDEEGNPKLEKGELLGKSGFKYYQCGTVSARGGNSSAITTPSGQGRTLTIDLGVNPQDSHLDKKVDWNFFYSLFVPHYDDPDDPKKLTWIEAKAHMGIAGGLTSFIDNGTLDLPSIYDGLVIDNQTIVWEVVDGVKTLVAKGGGSGEGTIKDVVVEGEGNAITNVELSSDKTGLVFTKGLEFAEKNYLDENFYNRTWIDEHYVTLGTSQTISGEKNFTGGLLVKGNEIVWDERGFWKLDGDLLVTGGIVSYADNPKYTPSTVMNALVLDNQTLDINEYGQLFVKNGGGSNVEIVESLPSEYKENTLYVVVQ